MYRRDSSGAIRPMPLQQRTNGRPCGDPNCPYRAIALILHEHLRDAHAAAQRLIASHRPIHRLFAAVSVHGALVANCRGLDNSPLSLEAIIGCDYMAWELAKEIRDRNQVDVIELNPPAAAPASHALLIWHDAMTSVFRVGPNGVRRVEEDPA